MREMRLHAACDWMTGHWSFGQSVGHKRLSRTGSTAECLGAESCSCWRQEPGDLDTEATAPTLSVLLLLSAKSVQECATALVAMLVHTAINKVTMRMRYKAPQDSQNRK